MFPAYAASSSLSDNEQGTTSAAWLCNSSFVPVEIKPNTLQCSDSSCTSSDKTDKEPTFKHKKKKRDKRRRKDNSDHKLKSSDMFYEDRSGDKGLLASKFQKSSKVGKANERGMAREKMVNSENLKPKKKKRKKTKRYFSKIIQGVEENETGETVRAPVDVQNFFKCTEEFNKKLRDEPQNEKLWVEYIQLQDKGEGSIQGIAEKKLAIIEKALAENPLSSILLNEKFAVSEKIFPLDKVASDAKALVIRDPRNIIGWNWLLKCNQFNLSRMTVPNVLTTYSSILQGLHSSHREYGAMLDVLLQCGLFLRQAGLWEQLWLLLQMYLDLNLTDPGSNVFKCKLTLPEDKIRELEDSIVTCGLPLGAIWLRIEHLREATNFLPIESGEDPQRIVFVDDVSHLLFPINRAEVPRLIAIIFVLLKVPPLPMLDCFLEFVGLKKINWAIESSELLLTATYDYGIVQMDIGYIGPAKELIVPPQYINEKLGEYEFFQFVNLVFENCEKYFGDKVPLLIWQMRWWRFIMKLQGKDSKNFHSKAKKLLKKYREDIPLYVEYALLEMDIGDFDATVKVLETAIALRESPLNVVNERGNICYLYKTFIEVLLKRDFTKYRVKALGILIGLALGKTTKDVIVTDQSIAKADERFGHLTTEILREVDIHGELTLSDLMLPNFSVSWLACHAWFIYLTKNVWESGTLIEKAIKDLKDSIGSSSQILGKCVLEHYFMIQTSLFHHYCHNNPGHFSTLHNILRSALLSFPENIYLLSVGASTGLNENNWWKSQSDCDSVLGNIFKIFTTREKMKNEECNSGAVNTQRMSNLLKQFSIHPILKACPLIWRLYLQFVNSESAAGIKKIFYQAVENCPWVKPIYYGAAQILPEELSQIQDLLVEKELRLHITPEEIEILRETDS